MGMDKPIAKKKWPAKRLLTYAASAAFVAAVGYGILFQNNVSTLNVKTERITISTVETGPFQEFIPITGNVLPLEITYLSAMEGGRVEIRYVEAGARVTKGDKILKLSNTNLLMTLLNNEAMINRASNDLRSTRLLLEQNRLNLERERADADYDLTRIKRKYDRYQVLFKETMISKQDYEDAKDEYEYMVKKRRLAIDSQEKNLKFQEEQVLSLEASVKRMESNLRLLKQQMESLTVRAPITGHLTALDAERGESKAPGDRLGQIDNLDGFRVRAQIDEHYINRVAVGRTGRFDIAAVEYELRIQKVFPEVKGGKFEVDLEFNGNVPEGIRRGQTLHIQLQLSERTHALLLPRGGFYQTTGGNWVYVVNQTGNFAVKRNIRLGRQNPRFFEVLEGLKPGERVITSQYENYADMERLVLE